MKRNFNEQAPTNAQHFDMRLFKNKQKEKHETFNCKYCNMAFDNKEKLKRHTKKAHGEKGGDISNPNPFGGFQI